VSGPRDRIEHVIVLMLENRSFDHLLGYLKHPDPSHRNLEDDPRSCPVNPANPDGPSVPATPDADATLGVDPGHSPPAIRMQLYGTEDPTASAPITMHGFVRSYANVINPPGPANLMRRTLRFIKTLWRRLFGMPAAGADIMRCFTEETAPVLCELAKHYALLVNWFSSVPGETWPNRNFAHAGTSHGQNTIVLDFYTDTTIFDRLGPTGWRIYHQGVPQVWVFPTLWLSEECRANFRDTERLFTDIRNKDLPKYTFIEPNHGFGPGNGNSQHPSDNTSSGESFLGGETLIARIYNALAEDQDFFATTLFLITYDEHGGFYDRQHPVEVEPPDGFVAEDGFDFSLSGVRVPAVAVSPLIPKGWIDARQFEHASIPKTLRVQFGFEENWLTQRDRVATDLLDDGDGLPLLDTPRDDPLEFAVDVPERDAQTLATKELNEFQASLVNLAGAVENTLSRGAPEALGPADAGSLMYRPTPATEQAARQQRLELGSQAHQDIATVLARFALPPPAPTDPEP
jgi:phospholipase C